MSTKTTKKDNYFDQGEPIIGSSPEVKRLRRAVKKIAQVDSNVLIFGETGTGKELVASQIYLQSPRHNRALIKINCSALGKTIGKKELYGAETEGNQVVKRSIGLLEKANNGVLLLDNIGDTSSQFQEELLYIMRDKTFRRIDGEENIRLDLRILSTSTYDLQLDVERGKFRKDLYYLLNTLILYIPPLRERKQDIPELFSYFLKKYCEQAGKAEPSVQAEIFESILEYDWKGNVRELENTVQNLIMMSPEGELSADYLPFKIKKHPLDFLEPVNLKGTIADIETFLIKKALKKVGGNQIKAAKLLGLLEPTLRFKLRKYSISSKSLK